MMKSQKGITLIALVITIIVMLILVGVTITMAINGNLFDYAKDARDKTNARKEEEELLSNGKVIIDGKEYDINEFAKSTATSSKTTD